MSVFNSIDNSILTVFFVIENLISFLIIHTCIISIVACNDLPIIKNGEVSCTPLRSVSPFLLDGQRYTGTIATYNCSSGYQLVGGSSLRACGADGEWNRTAPSCGKYCQWFYVSSYIHVSESLSFACS